MARRNVSGKRHSRRFNHMKKRTRAINNGNAVMRGGIRL